MKIIIIINNNNVLAVATRVVGRGMRGVLLELLAVVASVHEEATGEKLSDHPRVRVHLNLYTSMSMSMSMSISISIYSMRRSLEKS